MIQLHRSKPLVWAIFIVFCVVWFYALIPRTLVPTDEGRYAEMAREMLVSHDWITPRLNGIKYFEKPPLQTWMNALTFKFFGLGEWQARLWTGLTGLLGVLLAAYTGRKVFNARVGYISATVLGSCLMWAASAHFNTLDMGLSFMMELALCSMLLAHRSFVSPKEERNWMLVCWAGMALAVLSKGLIGIVLPGAVLVIYTVVTRDWLLWKRLHLKAGLLLFFAITAPWFILVSIKNPEFPHFFFIHEHFERFLTKEHHRAGPIYYFIPILLMGIVPWLGVFAQSLWRARREPGGGFKPRKMLLVWCSFIFVFFSVSGSKLPSYILPIFPALALLIGCYLQIVRNRVMLWSSVGMAALFAIGLAFTPKIATQTTIPFEQPLYAEYAHWVAVAAGIGMAGSLVAALLARLRLKDWSITALAITGFVCGQLIMIKHEPLGTYAAGTIHLDKIRAEATPQTPIYAVGRYEQVLPFYLGRTLTLVQNADEMEFGLEQQPELWLKTVDDFAAKWKDEHAHGEKALAIVAPGLFPELQKRGLPMRIIAQDPRRIIVANDPQ
jgi:4-amino-4-deoxy-L-arabinose transferase-like glycosyltransferase